MAQAISKRSLADAFSVKMHWQFDDDGGTEPVLNVKDDAALELIFGAFGAESVEELEDELPFNTRNANEVRLGVLTGAGDEQELEFHTEEGLLGMVEGIGDALASAFIGDLRDIPTICERRRRDGDVFLGDLQNDWGVDDRDGLDELEEFVAGLSHDDNLESRMKSAGVWVEPENVTAGF